MAQRPSGVAKLVADMAAALRSAGVEPGLVEEAEAFARRSPKLVVMDGTDADDGADPAMAIGGGLARRCLARVRDALWRVDVDGDGASVFDPEKEWDSEVMDEVADALLDAGLRPGPGNANYDGMFNCGDARLEAR